MTATVRNKQLVKEKDIFVWKMSFSFIQKVTGRQAGNRNPDLYDIILNGNVVLSFLPNDKNRIDVPENIG